MRDVKISALVVAHNEEAILDDCLLCLTFADEIAVVLDKCTDGSKEIVSNYTDRILEGEWDIEGDRRNQGIQFCRGEWILEVDADELITPELAAEVKRMVMKSTYDIFDVPVDNYVGEQLVRYGWMAAMGPDIKPMLFRKGTKTWGCQRAHPHLTVSGRKGPRLTNPIVHRMAKNLSDLIRRFDQKTTFRALDLRDSGEAEHFSLATLVRKMGSRFWKCFIMRRGYKEGGYGLVVSILSAMYPLVSHLKATLDASQNGTP